PNMRALWNVGRIKLPKLGRLMAHVPVAICGAWTEDAFFGARGLLVAAYADQDSAISLAREKIFQALRLSRGGLGCRRQIILQARFRRAILNTQVEAPFGRDTIPERIDFV